MRAPIVVFAYNRPIHIKRVLESLSRNVYADESELFVFIDGPKNNAGVEKNNEVYNVAKSFQTGYFKNVTIINHEKNNGLANSVISGVSEILDRYKKVVVIEDDSLASPYYLKFMNEALIRYENDKKIWSVGGFTVPMEIPKDYKEDVIFTQRCSSCAWGTWTDRWNKIDWSVPSYNSFRFDLFKRSKFNRWGPDKASMLDDQMNGRIDSWAIRFDYEMYRNNCYNVLPASSLIEQIGFDGSGTHTRAGTVSSAFHSENKNIDKLTEYNFPELILNERIRKSFNKVYYVRPKDAAKRYIGNLLYPFLN